ncbi:uncharacterized protein ACO6RY_12720 [Pungitius sinensis]
MAEEGLLERLLITEDGDARRGAASAEAALKGEAEHAGGGESEDGMASEKMCSEVQRGAEKPREDDRTGEAVVKMKEEEEEEEEEDDNNAGHDEMMRLKSKPEKATDTVTEDGKATQKDPQVHVKRLNSSQQPPEGTNREKDPKKAHRLTPDFPEALYELLCTLQEGRRLNDQRCSFQLEGGMRRRRCHSEPNTSKPANRVVFSSMTSLQKEEFFDLLATSQARRLDDQRSQLEKSQPAKPKSRGFRGSLKQLSFARRPPPAPVPVPVPKEDLYNMILTTQAQGRLEDQRCRAPGPMDDEDFFSLLLRVQGGRMDEQRTELPCMLQT